VVATADGGDGDGDGTNANAVIYIFCNILDRDMKFGLYGGGRAFELKREHSFVWWPSFQHRIHRFDVLMVMLGHFSTP
jgi:hypothetical protein